jgi:hypothetical protein
MIVKVMVGFAALLSTILGVAASRPKTFRMERSTSIEAPPESVFVLIDDLIVDGSESVINMCPLPAGPESFCHADHGLRSPHASENSVGINRSGYAYSAMQISVFRFGCAGPRSNSSRLNGNGVAPSSGCHSRGLGQAVHIPFAAEPA